MRYLISVILAGWTAGMAAVFAFGLFFFAWSIKDTVIDGEASTFDGTPLSRGVNLAVTLGMFGVYLGISAGGVAFGLKWLRILLRRSGEEVIPGPTLRDSVLCVRKKDAFYVGFALLVLAIGCGTVLGGVAGLLGLVPAGENMYVPVLVGGVFAAFGFGMLSQATSVAFDVPARTWRTRRGIWPLRSDTTGSLDEAKQITVARETRESDEGGSYEVAVARLEWSVAGRPPLLLTEGMIGWGFDYRPAVHRWAREVASVLTLPLVDETQTESQMPVGET